MSTYTFTAEDVAREAIRLAYEHPDAIYEAADGTCRYAGGTAAGRTGCLFGQALRALGVDETTLAERGDQVDPAIEDVPGISQLLGLLGVDAPVTFNGDKYEGIGAALDQTQTFQDNSAPWGRAIRPLVTEVAK